MKKILLCGLLLAWSIFAYTQEKEETIFTTVENPPQFEGGNVEMMKFFQKNLNLKNQDKVSTHSKNVVRFCVEKDGSISKVEPIKISDDKIYEEIKRVILLFPKFKPANQKGKLVRCWLIFPVFLNTE